MFWWAFKKTKRPAERPALINKTRNLHNFLCRPVLHIGRVIVEGRPFIERGAAPELMERRSHGSAACFGGVLKNKKRPAERPAMTTKTRTLHKFLCRPVLHIGRVMVEGAAAPKLSAALHLDSCSATWSISIMLVGPDRSQLQPYPYTQPQPSGGFEVGRGGDGLRRVFRWRSSKIKMAGRKPYLSTNQNVALHECRCSAALHLGALMVERTGY